MLEFNKWFFVLLANFLFLVWILNLILFKPLLRTFKKRKEMVKGDLEGARVLNEKKDQALEEMKKDLEKARQASREAYEKLRAEGLEVQKEIVSKAHEAALKETEKIKAEIASESLKARAALKGEVEKFSDSILQKLVAA